MSLYPKHRACTVVQMPLDLALGTVPVSFIDLCWEVGMANLY